MASLVRWMNLLFYVFAAELDRGGTDVAVLVEVAFVLGVLAG